MNEAVAGVDLDKVHVQVHVCYGYPDECYNDEVRVYSSCVPYFHEVTVCTKGQPNTIQIDPNFA